MDEVEVGDLSLWENDDLVRVVDTGNRSPVCVPVIDSASEKEGEIVIGIPFITAKWRAGVLGTSKLNFSEAIKVQSLGGR